MRTFVAIELEKNIKDILSSIIREVDTGEKNVKWINPRGMHLTLKFLGEIAAERTAEIKTALGEAVENSDPFEFQLKGTGTFPPNSPFPRVFWIGIEENAFLISLQAKIESELEAIGFPREKRSFHPHLTLGRVNRPRNLDPVIRALDQFRDKPFGSMAVDRVTLFQSVLRPTGAEYTVLSEHRLR